MSSLTMRQGQPVTGYHRHPGSQWIDQNRSRLPNNEWVAANGSGLVASDVSIDGLLNKIQAQDVDPADLTIAFITADSV